MKTNDLLLLALGGAAVYLLTQHKVTPTASPAVQSAVAQVALAKGMTSVQAAAAQQAAAQAQAAGATEALLISAASQGAIALFGVIASYLGTSNGSAIIATGSDGQGGTCTMDSDYNIVC